MSAIFENYDSFCEEVYRLFKYDLRGGENEYRVIGYMIFVAVSKAYEEQVTRISDIASSLDNVIEKHEKIGYGTRKGMMESVRLISELFDKKFIEIGELRTKVHFDLSQSIESEMSSMAARIIKEAMSKNGLTLNQQLNTTIQELSSASESAITNADRMTVSIRNNLASSTLRLFFLPLLGTFAGVLLVLFLQSIGAIAIPVEVNIDAAEFVQQILSRLR